MNYASYYSNETCAEVGDWSRSAPASLRLPTELPVYTTFITLTLFSSISISALGRMPFSIGFILWYNLNHCQELQSSAIINEHKVWQNVKKSSKNGYKKEREKIREIYFLIKSSASYQECFQQSSLRYTVQSIYEFQSVLNLDFMRSVEKLRIKACEDKSLLHFREVIDRITKRN